MQSVPSTWTDFSQTQSYTPPYTPQASGPYQAPGYAYAAYPHAAYQAPATPVYANAYSTPYAASPYAYPGYQYPAPDASNALVLYNPMGTLSSFNSPAANGKSAAAGPPKNPFTPGLEPLPVVPAPTTFVERDPVSDKFPCSTRQKDEVLGWITPTLFADQEREVKEKVAEKSVSLKQLRSDPQHANSTYPLMAPMPTAATS